MADNKYKISPCLYPELIEKYQQGVSPVELGIVYGVCLSSIYRILKKQRVSKLESTITHVCSECKQPYQSKMIHGIDKRQKFCSKRCRERNWVRLHPERQSELKHQSRLRKPVLCRLCHNPIPSNHRACGVVFCSDQCRDQTKKSILKVCREKAQERFSQHKISLGCSICGYNKSAAALGYHHTDPLKKERRITCKMWVSNSEIIQSEIKKCILLCSNCHAELHERMRQELD